MTNTPQRSRHASTGVTAKRLVTVAAATVAALAIWALATPGAGIALSVHRGAAVQSIGSGAVLAASLVAGLAAWALLAVLERVLRRPAATWTAAALVAFLVSLAGPLGGAAGAASGVALASMHVVVAAVLIPGLRRTARHG